MVMETLQIRLSKEMVDTLDDWVKTGLFTSRSDVLRASVRKMMLTDLVGILPDDGDSVKQVKELRKKLSKKVKSFKDIEEINKLDE